MLTMRTGKGIHDDDDNNNHHRGTGVIVADGADDDARLYSCSICLETVTDTGERGWAKLQCGHRFHLDCIGSAFNVKGAMQCPNCRKSEKGQWLYANGGRVFPEFINIEDWVTDEDTLDQNYSETVGSLGVHWCPFSGMTRLHPSFEEGEFPPSSYDNPLGQYAFLAEQAAVPSTIHSCPHVGYFGPAYPSSSNVHGSVSETSNFNSHWNSPPVAGEMPVPYDFPAMDPHHHSSLIGSAGQPRSPRSRFGPPPLPLIPGPSSNARAGSSVASAMVPSYPGSNARSHERVQALQAYSQQLHQLQQPNGFPAMHAHMINGRSIRGMTQAARGASSSDQTNGFFAQEVLTSLPNQFRPWERNHSASSSVNQMDRDLRSATGFRSGSFRQRDGSQRD